MPKTHKNLYSQLLSFESLYSAWLKSKKGRRYKTAVLAFEINLEDNLIAILDDLRLRAYQTGGYRRFMVFEPKKREISRLRHFRDRIVQHAIVATLNPIYESQFISDSFACRKGKGTHAGANRSQQMIRMVKREHGCVYALKCDIRKYFENIDHAILIGILKRKIGDKDMINLLENIISSYTDNRGIPLGNLTSQLFANIYLNELDQYVKRTLKERFYVRYMDDFVILSGDKERLHQIRKHLDEWLMGNLKLEMNEKTSVFPVAVKHGRPLDFLGYRITANRKRLRKRAIKALQRKVNKLHADYSSCKIGFSEVKKTLSSHIAHANQSDSHQLLLKIFDKPFRREINYYEDLHNA